ncbi:MAG TPA: hypothetical protein VMU54_08550 [Planctomycetota bacterium]|nr:hypothetical protein [Planctomycetota bacterium]
MRAFSDGRSRRSLLAALLALTLCTSPREALRMMLTLRSTPISARPGSCVGSWLRLQRRTPPQPIEAPGSLVIRKAAARPSASFDPEPREGWNAGFESAGVAARCLDAPFRMPAYLRSFLTSSPHHPVYPPSEPVPLAT